MTEPGGAGKGTGPSRGSVALVVVTLGLLAALVWVLHPSRPAFSPAPLRVPSPGCPQHPQDFTPSNITELPGLPSGMVSEAQRNRVLFRLNTEPCPCGCALSIAACLLMHPRCEASRNLVKKVVAEEQAETGRAPAR